MCAARNKADIGASLRELDAKIAANGAGAIDADLHEMSPRLRALTNGNKDLHHGPQSVRVGIGPVDEWTRAYASGDSGMRLRCVLMVECPADIADADHADQRVIVDDRDVANVMLVHQVPDVFERIS